VKTANSNIELSIVIPAFNEAEVIESTIAEVRHVCKRIVPDSFGLEILVVDDGSTDNTAKIVNSLHRRDKCVKLISLAKNSGHMAAISAGLDLSKGSWVVTMDADGQDPPETIEEMVKATKRDKADICYAIRSDRKADPIRHRLFSPAFYYILNKLTYGEAKIQAADFRLLSRDVVDVIKRLPERNRIYRVMIPDLKFKSTEVSYVRKPRRSGRSKYGFRKLAQLGLKSLLATSGASIRFMSAISILTALLMLAFAVWVIYLNSQEVLPSGWASLSTLLALTLLMQSLSTAVISEVLIQINTNIRNRPLYQIKK
jgi:glycosyltransferase involved in cell wall biosynthesis